MLARVLGRVIDRVLPFLGEDLGRHLALDLVQDLELAALGQRRRLQLRVVEVAAEPRVLVVEQVLVRPLEVVGEIEGQANARILELRAPDIEGERLHARDAAHGQRILLDVALADRIEVIARGPELGARLAPEIEMADLECLEGGHPVAIVGVADLVEVPLTLADGQILGPPVLDALVGNAAAGIHLLDAVGSRAQRNLERRLGKIARLAVGAGGLPEMLGQDRQLADDHRQLAVALDVEDERDLIVAGLLGLGHVLVVEGEVRRRLLDGVEREDHVLGRDRLAVMEARLRTQLEGRGAEVVGKGDPFGEQAIGRRRLVGAALHQLVVEQAQADRRIAPHRKGIERVEGPKRPLPHAAALRRVGIDPVEMSEALVVGRLADQRERVVLGEIVRRRRGRSAKGKHEGNGRASQATCPDHASSRPPDGNCRRRPGPSRLIPVSRGAFEPPS